jgi:hypothetical protein
MKLFTERTPVKLKDVKGDIEYILPPSIHSVKIKSPLMKNSEGSYSGYSSGRRGAILAYGEDFLLTKPWIRIKGCGYLQGPVLLQSHNNTPEPEGGQLQSDANNELRVLSLVNTVLSMNNVPNSATPIARFDYKWYKFLDEQCSASVYKIKGDTRLDEFLCYLFTECLKKPKLLKDELVDENVRSLLKNIGVYCAGLLDILYSRGVTWNIPGTEGTNAHIGNFVVFEDSLYKIRIGIVDFDGQTVKNIYETRDKIERNVTELKKFNDSVSRELSTVRGSIFQGVGLSTISGDIGKPILPKVWCEALDKGFVSTIENMRIQGRPKLQPIDFNVDKVFRRIVETSLKPRRFSVDDLKTLLNNTLKNYKYKSVLDDYLKPYSSKLLYNDRNSIYDDIYSSKNLKYIRNTYSDRYDDLDYLKDYLYYKI